MAATEDPTQIRHDLANNIFNFLYSHALCMEGQEAPCDWVYDGAYDLHRAAGEIYSDKALKDIKMPVSDYKRGGYADYYNPLVYLEHESLMWRVFAILNFGVHGIPKPEK